MKEKKMFSCENNGDGSATIYGVKNNELVALLTFEAGIYNEELADRLAEVLNEAFNMITTDKPANHDVF